MIRTISLQRALLVMVGAALLSGIIPTGIALDRRLAAALETRVRAELAVAPRVLADRNAASADAMMMHAKEFAHIPELAEALARHDRAGVLQIADAARDDISTGIPVVVGATGESWTGPALDTSIIARTRAGQMPVAILGNARQINSVALAPVHHSGQWVGAAGVAVAIDEQMAEILAGLTRSEVVIVATKNHSAVVSTLDPAGTAGVLPALASGNSDTLIHEVLVGGRRLLVVAAPLESAGSVVFVRKMDDELSMLPQLRRMILLSAFGALLLALALGTLFATRISRPVRQLSSAASAMGAGDFGAPLPRSRIREVAHVAATFGEMREALSARLADLRTSNAALQDRSVRLAALQSDMLQRERLAATGRLVVHLAHEIRNPVATVRNCLELIRRRVRSDPEACEFADLATDELLRMHELAEQMLDLNRPRDPAVERAHAGAVAREVQKLATAGVSSRTLEIAVEESDVFEAAIAPDALKQVLINLVQNAREAMELDAAARSVPSRIVISVALTGETAVVEVRDNGPGIPEDVLPRIFDPFFTTKNAVRGIGLGLFVAEGLVRTAGGRLSAGNRSDDTGAWFRIELPVARAAKTDSYRLTASEVAS
ncbi:MAG: sensor histidine kinase [Gemmatimonadaceae bacterium]